MKKNLTSRIVYLVFSLVLPLVFLGLMSQINVHAANLVVTTTNDGGAGSLRQAVLDANQNPGPDTITFDLVPQSILTLTYGTLADFLVISDTLTIDGGTAVSLTISGNNERNIFTIGPGTAVTITDLTLMDGKYDGGAIHNDGGILKLMRMALVNNGANDNLYGGAIFNKGGQLSIQDSQLLNNESEYGAGIQNCKGGVVTLTSSRFLENSVTYAGSALYNLDSDLVDECGVNNFPGTITISDTIFSDNFSNGAATVLNEGEMSVTSSTIQNNEAELDGGGIINEGNLDIFSSIVMSNTTNTNDGGGIYQFTGTITISHSLIENNTSVERGGGVAIIGGKALIENSEIISNSGSSIYGGGGVFNQSVLSVVDSKIMSNTATNLGGGILNYNGGKLEISDSDLGFNRGGEGGGLTNRGHAVIINSLFRENEAEDGGGAIDNVGPTFIVSQTVFFDNTAGYGGAIYNYNSHFENNSAVDSGGAIDSDYGILHLENSTVENNIADQGGGIFNFGQLFIKNSTISKNTAIGTDSEDGGGGIMQAYRNITMTHVTIADNVAPNQTGRDGIWQSDGNTLIQQSIVASNGRAHL